MKKVEPIKKAYRVNYGDVMIWVFSDPPLQMLKKAKKLIQEKIKEQEKIV